MYAVSAAYKTAIADPARSATRMTGTITLAGGGTVPLTDSIISQGSMTLDDYAVQSDLEIGNVAASVLNIGLLLSDDLQGATITPIFGIDIGGGTFEDVPLGKFWVVECPRENGIVRVKAIDGMYLLTAPVGTPPATGTPYTYLSYAATAAGLTMAQNSTQIAALPNGGLSITYPASSEIVTLRDLVMWVSYLIAGFAWIDRDGKMSIRRLTGSSVRNIADNIRADGTYVSDIIKTVSGVSTTVNGVEYRAFNTPDTGSEVIMADNPLIRSESDVTINTVLTNMLGELDGISYRPFQAEVLQGDPALEPGDLVTLTGGIAGAGQPCLVTHSHWQYRGKHALEGIGRDNGLPVAETQDGKKILRLYKLVADIVEAALFKGKKIELGGLDNGNGELEIQDASGNIIVAGNKDGLKLHLPARAAGTLAAPLTIIDDQASGAGRLLYLCSIDAGGIMDGIWSIVGRQELVQYDASNMPKRMKSYAYWPTAGGVKPNTGDGVIEWEGMYLVFGADGKFYLSDGAVANEIITGTPGAAGNLGSWNADGDLADSGRKPSDFVRTLYDTLTGSMDFNNMLTEGGYNVAGGAGFVANGPYTGTIWGKLRVYVNDGTTHNNLNNWIWQIFDDTSGRRYYRYKVNADAWQAWRSVITGVPGPTGNLATWNGVALAAGIAHTEFTDWVPTLGGFSVAPAGGIYRYKIFGKMCICEFRQPNNGTSNATTFTITLPFTTANIAVMLWVGVGSGTDNGADLTTPIRLSVGPNTNILTVAKDMAGGAWTASGNKRIIGGSITFEIA